MAAHDVDDGTEFCVRCGASAAQIKSGEVSGECPGGGNLRAISHRRALEVGAERLRGMGLRVVDPKPRR